MSNNKKIKILQGLCFFGGPLVLLFNFNLTYLLLSWLFSWIVVHIGISVGMHRCFSHTSWQPRNRFILIVLHFLALINVVGSSIAWTGTHRQHHAYSDTDRDPHRIEGQTAWTKIKYWFNYWPTHKVELRFVKDLIRDPYHKFFHKHYFTILYAYMLALYFIHIDLFLYGFVVATMFSLHTISWITVGAHIFGHQDHDVDSSKNTWFMGLYMWGEGWHNNHHKAPWSYAFGWNRRQPDFGKWLIEKLAKPNSLKGVDYYDKVP